MSYLSNILEEIKADVKLGIIRELEQEQPLVCTAFLQEEMIHELAALTEAVIDTVKQNTFTSLKVHLSWMCKLSIEREIRLANIMEIIDLYEKSMKDAMSIYLRNDLVSLNRYRREIDTLLDKARVYLSDYFFVLYESTVFKQFEQLRIINKITNHLTSSLDLNEVLKFIMTNAITLFKADCGSILLIDQCGILSARIAHGWRVNDSPGAIMPYIADISGVTIIHCGDTAFPLKAFLKNENLCTIMAIKLHLQERVIGVLIIGFRTTGKLTPTEERVLETFANQAAIAVNNAQLYKEKDKKLQERIREATILLEQNRALVQSMREGVIAIDRSGVIYLINNEAQRLLNLDDDIIGRNILQVIPNSRLPIVVETRTAEYDQIQSVGTSAIITNRVPIIVNGEVIGAIATFRDRQDVKALAEELTGVKSLLESMRAQSHEFINKLHAISGLIEMEQYNKVIELITDIYRNRQECVSFIVKRIKDQATAGLLLGKISQAAEQAIILRLNPRSKLISLSTRFTSISMVTILGNLISNAIDAVAALPNERKIIEVYIFKGVRFLTIKVRDYGCGIPAKHMDKIYQRGFSIKPGNRGLGLALIKQEVEMSGGRVSVNSVENQGSEFVVRIPVD